MYCHKFWTQEVENLITGEKQLKPNSIPLKDFHLIKNATNSCEFFKKKLFAKKGKIVCKNCKYWYLPYFPL